MAKDNEFLEDYGNPTAEQNEMADKITEILKQASEAYEKAFDIIECLDHDNVLQEEYSRLLGVLLALESEEEHDDMELIEKTYLRLIDNLIRLSKVMHPISGFGAERLLAAYELLDTFQEVYHPLLTRITEENIDAFAKLLSEKEYDEVLYNRKKAVGALRMEGEDTYAAGVAVYTIDKAPVTGGMVVKVDRIYVDDAFRSFGTGNLLMAAMVRPMLSDPDARLVISYKPIGTADEDNEEYAEAVEEEFDRIEEYLTSWRFNFTMDLSHDFFISAKDLENSQNRELSTKGIVSLRELGKRAKTILKKYFTKLNNEYNERILSTPGDYYDEEASFIYTEDGENAEAMLLCHRYSDGDYLIDYIGIDPEDEMFTNDVVMRLLCSAKAVMDARGDKNSIISGTPNSEEGFRALKKLAPKAKAMLSFDCMLSMLDDDQTLTSAQWEILMNEAGYGIDEEAEEG